MTDQITRYDWTVTEERKTQLSATDKRLLVEHSVHLHRDAQSIDDLRKMLDVLVESGAPPEATIYVNKTDNPEAGSFVGHGHLRVLARWYTDQAGVTDV